MQYLTGPLSVLGAGAMGAVVRLIVAPPRTAILQRIAYAISGAAMALFVAPAIVEHWLRSEGPSVQRAIAAAVGAFGPELVGIAIRAIQRRGDGVADRLVDRVTGSREEP